MNSNILGYCFVTSYAKMHNDKLM